MTKTYSQQKQRHRARRLAMQALYQWHYTHSTVDEIIPNVLADKGDMKFDRTYFELLLKGVVNDMDAIDLVLQSALDRKIAELNPVELAVLRVATYEMLHCIDIPYRVVINEAVELTKDFGSDQGHKYVNAVLDKLAKQHRTTE